MLYACADRWIGEIRSLYVGKEEGKGKGKRKEKWKALRGSVGLFGGVGWEEDQQGRMAHHPCLPRFTNGEKPEGDRQKGKVSDVF